MVVMAAGTSGFEVPSWEGNAGDPEAEQLSQALFQTIPSTANFKRRTSKDRRSIEAKKKEPHSKPRGLLWSDDYDDYFNSLNPDERLNVLLRKLRKNNNKSKSVSNDEEGGTAKRGKKMNENMERQADTIATAGQDATGRDLFDIRNEPATAATAEDSRFREVSKVEKKKRKKPGKQDKASGGNSGLVKARECEDVLMKEDLNDASSSNASKVFLDHGSRTKMAKSIGNVDMYNGFHSKSLRDSEIDNGMDSKKRRRSKVKKNKEKSEKSDPMNDCPSVAKSIMGRSSDLKRREQVAELHSSSSSRKINTSFQNKLQKKLSGAQFRYINEQLYTLSSERAHEMFTNDPSLFDVYHRGFQSQVQSWPQNPIDLIIKDLRNRSEELVVADMGCGEAKIAQNVRQKVHSFDLIAQNSFAVACDMSQVPLNKESVDMVIFCLSLMGKNIGDFLWEANRILKIGGILKIAEVVSRFDNVGNFIDSVSTFGFSFLSKDTSNRMFILMDFKKTELPSPNVCLDISLKPCLYKKR